jgi:class 3 adenylate cyclase/tetratricopeptide (TPR) repeat protein
MQCGACRFDNPDDGRFCQSCGTPLTRRCGTCAFENVPGARFCGGCGAAFDTAPAAAPEPAAPEAERRQLTVLFCDLVGSTALSARLDPEDMRDVLRAYQNACSGAINRYDGYVAKFMGDGVYAYFGYPTAHEDDAERAVHAGLAIVEAVGALKRDLAVRIGIATGTVAVGDIVGEGASEEANVVGDAPNLAARLQEIAGPDTVVVGEATRTLIGELFETEDLGILHLKGFTEPVGAWAVLRARQAGTRFEATRGVNLSRMIGREEEMAALTRRWERAKSGEGQVVLVSGEAGIGKSRLIHEFREGAADGNAFVRTFQCSPQHTASALFPLINVMMTSIGLTPDDSAEDKLDKLEAWVGRGSQSLDAMVPVFGVAYGIDTSSRYPPLEASPQRHKQLLMDGLIDRMINASRSNAGCLFVYEDAHWMDPTSLEIVDSYIGRAPGLPVMIIVSYRPEFDAPWVGQAHTTLLALNRLSRSQSAALASDVGQALPPDVAAQIADRTDGVPLFVEEMTKSIVEAERQGAGPAAENARVYATQIPATLQDALEARLDRLGEARELAQIGAVIGRGFGYELLAAVSDLGTEALAERLGRLVDSELVSVRGAPPEAVYTFKHALVQDVAYGSLLRARREALHRRVAECLHGAEPEVLALHYTGAGDHKTGTAYWLKAGRRSAERSAMNEAVSHLSTGLETLEQISESRERDRLELDLLSSLIMPLRMVVGSGHERVEQAYDRARAVSRDLGDTDRYFPLAFDWTMFGSIRGNYAKAIDDAEQLLQIAQAEGDPAKLFRAHLARGHPAFHSGDLITAREHLAKAVEIREGMQRDTDAFVYFVDSGIMARCYYGQILQALGYWEKGHAWLARGLEAAQRLGQENAVCFALFHMGYASVRRDDVEFAQASAEECRELAEAYDLRLYHAPALVIAGWAKARLKGRDDVFAEMRDGLDGYSGFRMAVWSPVLAYTLADAQIRCGRIEDGIETLRGAFAQIERTGEREFESALHVLHGDALLARDSSDHAGAENRYRHAMHIARSQSAKSWELRAANRLAGLWQSQGKSAEARDLLAPVHGWFTEGFDSADLIDAKTLLDELS